MQTAQLRLLLQRADQHRQAGQFADARGCCAEVLRHAPDQPDALLMLAGVALAQGLRSQAQALLERAVAANPTHAPSWLRLSEVLEDQGQVAAAEAAMARAAGLLPHHAPAHYNHARLLRAQGRREAASAALERARTLPGSSPTLHAQMLQLQALMHEDAGDLESALLALEHALQAAPNRAALHHNRGVLLHRLSRPLDALQAHDRALALGLDVAEAHYNRGNSLQSLGRSSDALQSYRAALARDPQYALALYDAARLRWRLGDAEFATELDAAEAAAPHSPVAPGIKGRLLLRAERHAEAAEAFARAAHLGPAAGYFDGLGQALARLGRHDEALHAHRQAVALAPELAATHISHAACLLQAGQAPAAVVSAQTAVRLAPTDQQAWAMLDLAWRATDHPGAQWLNDYGRMIHVYELEPPPGWPDIDAFNAALTQALLGLHTDDQAPIDQTLRHGSQTLGDIFEQRHPLIQQLRDQIAQQLDRHVRHLRELAADPLRGLDAPEGVPPHPLLSRVAPKWRFSDSWSSRLRRGGFHTHHVHPHGWISSCYYVAVPPTVTATTAEQQGQPGWIAFGLPDFEVPALSQQAMRTLQPRPGTLVLFPSFTWHGTVPFDDEAMRLTVAFDVLPQAL